MRYEGSLEEQGEVGVIVDHALLGNRECAGLADHQIGPLHAHNGDQVAALRVSQSLGRVADLALGDIGVAVEGQAINSISPSADRPRLGLALDEEQTYVDAVVLVAVPVKGLGGGALVSLRVEVVLVVAVAVFGETGLNLEVGDGVPLRFARLVELVARADFRLVGVVPVFRAGEGAGLERKAEGSAW